MARQRVFLSLIAAFALVQSVATPTRGQAANSATNQVAGTAAVVDPVMPKDANAAMLLAARVNGLAGMDKPWHLKANYQTFDADGKPKDQGVFEEWWAGPEKYKVSYASSGFNQVEYRNGEETRMVGDVKWPPTAEAMVEQLFLHPMPPASEVEGKKYVAKDVKDGALPLMCVHVDPPPEAVVSSFCFATGLPAVRIAAQPGNTMAFFNQIVRADGHYMAEQIRVQIGPHPLLNANVEALDFPPAVDDAEFVAPASAVVAPPLQTIPGDVIAGYKISGPEPEYPPIARAAHVQGVVVMAVRISTNGTVDDLRVISGPPMLRQATLHAVKTWKYRPYLLNGQPVEVKTQVNVVFTLGFGGGIPSGKVN